MSNDKIIITTCIGIGIGAISGITWNILSDKRKETKTNVKEGSELITVEKPCCKCPMANFIGVAITGGVLSGALAWIYYPK